MVYNFTRCVHDIYHPHVRESNISFGIFAAARSIAASNCSCVRALTDNGWHSFQIYPSLHIHRLLSKKIILVSEAFASISFATSVPRMPGIQISRRAMSYVFPFSQHLKYQAPYDILSILKHISG